MNNQQFSDSGERRSRRPRRRVRRRAGSPSAATLATGTASQAAEELRRQRSAKPAESEQAPSGEQGAQRAARPLPEVPSVDAAPTVSIALTTSGIHPETARIIAIAAVFYGAGGGEVASFIQALNPGEDPGPWHLHGFEAGELAQEIGFATAAPSISEAIEGREVIVHDVPLVWGFLTHEFRRARRAANRGRGRSGRGRGRNRAKAIATPQPRVLVDTLATTRRQEMAAVDPRPRAIARLYGLGSPAEILPELGAVASTERGEMPAAELLLADARLLAELNRVQAERASELAQGEQAGEGAGQVARVDAAELTADQFGLQRSTVRVDAINAPHPLENPGVPTREQVDGQGSGQGYGQGEGAWKLVAGMEFVLSPDVAIEPDELIEAGVSAGLVYAEKMNRTSSFVVCNQNFELRGKAMHADRKDIPLLSDEEFLAALEDVAPGKKRAPEDNGGRGRGGRGGRSNNRGGSRGGANRSGSNRSGSRNGGRDGGRGGSNRSGGRSGGGNRSGSNRGGGQGSQGGNRGGSNRGGGQRSQGSQGGNRGGGKANQGGQGGNSGPNHGENKPKKSRNRRGGRRRGRGRGRGQGNSGQSKPQAQ